MVNTVTVPGPISGTPYRFRIEGERPTVDEQRNIDALLSQREQEFQTRYAEAFGAPVDTGESTGLLNYLGEIPKGIGSGLVGLLESGALGAADALSSADESPAREFIRRAGYTLSRPFAPDIGLEDTYIRRLGEGLGSFGGLLAVSAIPGAGPYAATGLAVAGGAGEASERAFAAGATPEERRQALLPGAFVGGSEMIPINLVRILGREAVGGIANRIARAGLEGGVEGAQEAAAQIAQNLIEQGIYNPERDTFEGAGEAATVGGGVGALVQGLLDLALPRTRGGGGTGGAAPTVTPGISPGTPAAPTPTPAPATPETAPELEMAERVTARMRRRAPELEMAERVTARMRRRAPTPTPAPATPEAAPAVATPPATPEAAPVPERITVEEISPLFGGMGAGIAAGAYDAIRRAAASNRPNSDLPLTEQLVRAAQGQGGPLSDADIRQMDALADQARSLPSAQVNDFLRTQLRSFLEGRRVQPQPQETETQLRAAAEPDRTVERTDGARPEDGGRGAVAEPGPVVDQPARGAATPEPGGLDAGERDTGRPDTAEGDVEPTLTPEEQRAADVPFEATPAPAPARARRTSLGEFDDIVAGATEQEIREAADRARARMPQESPTDVVATRRLEGGPNEGVTVRLRDNTQLFVPGRPDQTTVDQAVAEYRASIEPVPDVDPDTLSAPQRVLDVPLGDTVVEALRAGDIRAALERLPAAVSDRTMGKLAMRLRPFMDGVSVRIVPATDPRLVARDNTVRPGAYFPSTGEILINAETGLNPQTLLHEAVHAATISVLSNPSHPLTRQIEQIRERAAEVLPAYNYGLQDRFEFVSEGMTNPEFIRDLSFVETPMGDERVSLGRRFVTAVTNFLRGLVNQPKRPFRPVKTELDNLFESLLAPAAEYRGTGTVIDALYGPGRIERAKKMLGSLSERTVEATPTNMAEVRQTIRDTRIPVAAKDAIARWAVPLPFIVQYASKYMPSAPLQKQAMDALHAEQRKLNGKVEQTGKAVGVVYAKYQDLINDMERLRLGMSEPGALFDMRKPYEYYSKYYFEFNVLDDEGNIIGTRRSKAFDNAGARNRAMGRFNDRLPKNRTSATAVNPRTPEQLARQRELRRIQRSLPEDAQKAIERALALPEFLLGELQEALRGRVAAISEDARQTTRVMNVMYDKVFSPNQIEGYQGFIRKGDYGISYEAIDPDTGKPEVFKHSFQSPALRLKARELLAQKGDDVTQIKFYQTGGQAPRTRDVRPPLRFVSDILAAVERSGGPENDALKEEILDLYWDATPESSFAQTFRRRFGTPGYEQDQTLLSLEPNAGAAMDNIVDANSRLAYQITGIKYGNRIEEINAQLDLELQRSVDQANQTITNPVELDADIREAYMHREILRDYSRKPLQKNAPWTATVNSGLYALTLGLNVSSVAIQTFHVPMFTVTYQAPKYGIKNTTQGMGVASRYITKSGRQRTLERVGVDGKTETFREDVRWWNASLQNYDYDNDAKVRWLSPLNAAMERNGFYTDSVTLEMACDAYDIDAPGRRTAGSLVRKGAAVSGLMQHQVERYIRESVTMNAYMNMLKQTNRAWKGMSLKQFVRALEDGSITVDPDVAAKIAQDAVTEGELLNGSIYSSSGPAKSTEDGWNVVYLFKKFGLSMMNLLWHTAMRSVPPLPDPSDPGYAAALQDRRVARLQFVSMAGSIGLLSGAAGMPMFGAIANLYNLLKDDEDEDFETLVRTGVLGEFGLNGAVNYITGLNIAPRIGMSGIFYREPFNVENNTPLTNLIEGFGGPAVGMFNKYTDRAIQLFQDGEIWRGTEAVMPSFVANGLRTIRFLREDGFRTMRGDPIIEDIGPFHLAGQFFGFQPAEYAQQLALNSQQQGTQNAISRERTRLLSRLYRAHRARDLQEYREVMADIREYNREAEDPNLRITRDTISRSLNSHQATTERTVNGIAYSPLAERILRERATDWGPVSFFQ